MSLNWSELLKRTSLSGREDIATQLDRMGIVNQKQLQNLPGTHGRPWFCGNSTYEVVSQLNRAIRDESQDIPVIDQATMPEPQAAAAREPVTQETLLASLDLLGISESQLKKLAEARIETVGDVMKDSGERIENVPGFGEATKERLVSAVKTALDNKEN